MRTDERYDDPEDDPSWASPYVDGALQNLAAFGTGLTRLTGHRRTAAKLVVWLILISTGLTILYGVVSIVRMW